MSNAKARMYAKGRMKTGERNATEQAFEDVLKLERAAGVILWYSFEGIKLRLADNTFYTVDFPVLRADGILEMREVKGYWTDDARVKIKVAAEQYPFVFAAYRRRSKKEGGGWEREEF